VQWKRKTSNGNVEMVQATIEFIFICENVDIILNEMESQSAFVPRKNSIIMKDSESKLEIVI